jgi:Uma2 family endonuclease
MAAAYRPRNATFVDLALAPEDIRAEIIHGEIVEKAGPTMAHGVAQCSLAGCVGRWFRGGGGGPRPGGWWIGTEVDVEYEAHEVFRHDAVGWRRDRVPECPRGRPVRVRPDWVCEILSPSNEKRDLVDKLRVLQRAGVPHYWVVNPEEKLLVVHRLEPQGYLVALSAAAGESVRAEPFDAIEMKVSVLLGDEEED